MTGTEVALPLSDRFLIRERLGSGGMGVVYAAYDRERDETVALKTLHRRDASSLYSFKKEFRTLADVAHPNLVSLYELIAEDDRWFFTMELIDGVNFIDYIRPHSEEMPRPDQPVTSVLPETLPLAEAMAVAESTIADQPWPNPGHAYEEPRLRAALEQLAVGVRALHNAGKMHRDLKPYNVLVTAEGRVVILDFGIARELAPSLSQLTAEAGFLGTLTYMAPEQARGEQATPASDWYAVGVMLFEALTGRLPFTGALSKVMSDKLQKRAPSPADRVQGLPEDLVELCEALLARDPPGRPSAAGVFDCLGSAESPLPDQSYLRLEALGAEPMEGRRVHLEILADAFRKTREGQAVSVHVHGTSGMGKTAIVHLFLRRLIEASQAVVLPGRCHVRELVPYKALDGVIDSLSKYLLSLPRHEVELLLPREIQTLARVFPVLSRVEAIAQSPHMGRGVVDRLPQRRLAFAALRELLRRIAEHRPVVLYIDDLQWADADSAALLGEILRPPDPPQLLLITCFRSEEINSQSFLSDLVSATGKEDCIELAVQPLTDRDASRLTAAMLGSHPGLDSLIKVIVREARGNPFLIEQLVGYAMAMEADLARTGLDIRITLAEMLETRIRHLPPGAEALLLTLAAAGRPIGAAVAHQAAGLDGDERQLIATLKAAHLVRSSGSANSVELYNDRLRESLATRVDPAAAERIHRRLATILIEHGHDDPEALFTHYRCAGEAQRAAEQATLAARKASQALAFDRAALFYLRALDLGRFESSERLALQRDLAESLANAGRPLEAAANFLELAETTEGLHALGFRSRAAQEYLAGGYFDKGVAALRIVFAAVGLKMPSSSTGALLSLLWQRLRLKLRPRGLAFDPQEEDRIAREDLLRIDTCYTAAASLATADTIRGADFQTRQLRLALDVGEPLRVARAMGLEVSYRAAAGVGQRRRATRLLARTEQLARLADDPFTSGLCHLHAGLMAYCFGEWKKAAERCDEAIAVFTERCTGAIWEVTFVRRYNLSALMHLGEMAEVSRRLPGLLAEADERGNVLAGANLRTRLGIHWLAADDPDTCIAETARALEAWSQQGFHVVHFNGLISKRLSDLYLGDGERAFRKMLGQWTIVQRSYVPRIQVARIEGLFLRARCALGAAAIGVDRRQALRIATRAAARIAREKLTYGKPQAELILAACAHLEGRERIARQRLQSAARGFETNDMRLLAAAAKRRLGELSGGDGGAVAIAAADAWMRSQSIRRPDRMTATLAPGFDKAQPA